MNLRHPIPSLTSGVVVELKAMGTSKIRTRKQLNVLLTCGVFERDRFKER
jgi:hypothetical protein